MKKNILIALIALTQFYFLHAQTTPSNHIQPKIMVIPRVGEGQDMKTEYDSDVNMQIAIAKINEAFQNRGANLRSFDQALKQAKENMAINKSSGNQEDFKSTVLQMSGADIYVETKITVVNHPQMNAKSVILILDAYQTGTANPLADKTIEGRMVQTDDIGKLVMLAIDTVSESFLNLLQLKFDDIVSNGQSIYVEFSLGDGSQYTFDSEIGPDKKLLSEVIDEWFQKNTVKGVYNNQGVTGNKLIISDARIPIRNPANPNANYTGQNFYGDILRYFRTLNIQIKREIGTNNKILITIL